MGSVSDRGLHGGLAAGSAETESVIEKWPYPITDYPQGELPRCGKHFAIREPRPNRIIPAMMTSTFIYCRE